MNGRKVETRFLWQTASNKWILGFNALQLSDDRDPNALHREPLTGEMVTLRALVDEDLTTPRRPEFVTAPPRVAAGSPQPRQLDRQAGIDLERLGERFAWPMQRSDCDHRRPARSLGGS